MATIHDLAEEWLKARAALIEQLSELEPQSIHPLESIPETQREVIAAHIQGAIDEYDALLAEYTIIQADLMRDSARRP